MKAAGRGRIFGSAARIIRDSFRRYPGQSAGVVACIVFAGLAESLGLLTLLPVINLSMKNRGLGEAAALPSRFEDTLNAVLSALHLPATLPVLLCLVVAAIAAKGFLLLAARTHLGAVTSHVATDLRLQLVRALLSASWLHFVSTPAGRFGNALGTEAARASTSYLAGWYIVASAIQIVIFLAVSMLLSPGVFLAGIAVGIFVALCLSWTIRVARQAGNRETALMATLVARLTDHLNGIKPLKSMGLEKLLLPFMEEDARGLRQAQRQQAFAAAAQGTLPEPLLIVFLALGLYWALTFTDTGLPQLFLLAVFFQRVMGRFSELQKYYQILASSESAWLSLAGMIGAAEAAAQDRAGGLDFGGLENGIRFDAVGFAYGGAPVLRDASFVIPANGLTTLYGPSGCGKTTVADLVTGLLRPQSGAIHFDGTPAAAIDPASLRRAIGYVPQEVFLFHDTLMNNITLRDPSLTESDVWAALERADAADFVRRMEGGLNADIGERGARLSGGQRQRIMIARALARRPRILILDEATTALDPETERLLCATIRNLSRDTTVIAISHQPAIREISDHVIDMRTIRGLQG